jgi:hypothetical protein
MIQRIQTIWMFLAALCALLSIKLPFYVGTNTSGVASYQLNGAETILLLIITVATGVVPLVAIFLYKDRKMQLRLCVVAMLLEVITLLLYYREYAQYTQGTFALTAILQAAVLAFLFLAIKGIRNDNQIIRDSERLR